ncbi:MAG: hypothetical protein ACNA7K_04060 [Acholeplasmataceae bacterium]
MKTWINQKTIGRLALLSTVVFIVFVLTVLPSEAQKSTDMGLLVSPDTLFHYTASRLYEIAQSYGMIGRQFYVRQRFTFDLIWPVIYTSFTFFTTLYFIYKLDRIRYARFLLSFSVLAFVFDLLENISLSIVMTRYPKETFLIDHLAGFMTAMKWVTLSLSFLMLFILIYDYLRGIFSNAKK